MTPLSVSEHDDLAHKHYLKITATLASGQKFSVSIANPTDAALSNALRLLSETIRIEISR